MTKTRAPDWVVILAIFCPDALALKLKTHLIIANRSMAAITGPASSLGVIGLILIPYNFRKKG